jgi:hypothetical protein
MKRKTSTNKTRTIIRNAPIRSEVDAHKWATKMEAHRLLSGKRDLEIKTDEKKPD